MLLRSFKKTIIFSVVAVLCYGLLVSCENPFSNNLGSKVDIEPPTVTVTSPTAGAFIKGVTRFAGFATAYRELRNVEVRVSADQGRTVIQNWTPAGVLVYGDDPRNKNWYYDLNTLGIDDGQLIMEFRASDINLVGSTVPLIYIVKNKPPKIQLTAPEGTKMKISDPSDAPKITTGMEIRGQIIDNRGLKPGYPMIKIWPADRVGGEPEGDDENWGWASLFLSGTDDTDADGNMASNPNAYAYKNRFSLPVVRSATFVFRLAEFTINQVKNPVTDEIVRREIVYNTSGNEYHPLPSKKYNFRIIGSDSFFYNVPGTPSYLWPRDPIPGTDEVVAVGYYPEDTSASWKSLWDYSDSYYTMELVSSNVPINIYLNNDDIIPATILDETPHIYLTEPPYRKIVRTGLPSFRLRILAAHPESEIASAELSWENIGKGTSGVLNWNGTGANAGVLKDGGNVLAGRYFAYTAPAGEFASSDDPYYFNVKVTTLGQVTATQRYTVYLNGDVPTVTIRRSIMGAYSEPSGDALPDTASGGFINGLTNSASYYTVNGNIQVSIDRSAGMGIKSVKWIVEDETSGAPGAAGTMLARLRTYYGSPSAANFAFYDNIGTTATSGNIQDPLSDTNAKFDADKTYHLKFNTVKGAVGSNAWDKQNLWLYVIAQDNVQNLGFSLQKLYVDDSTDIPKLDVPGLDSSITDADQLHYYTSTGTPLNTTLKNVLSIYDGIDLTFTDDDGVSPGAGNITITLTDLNVTPNVNSTLTNAQLLGFLNGKAYLTAENAAQKNSREWIGTLSQKIMAQARYGAATTRENLPDGLYKLAITVRDNVNVKVAISGSQPGDVPVTVTALPEEFYFAVRSTDPVVKITNPVTGSIQNDTLVNITGTVESSFKLKGIDLTFTPDIIEDGGYSNSSTTVSLASLSEPTYNNTSGKWVYNWTYPNVNFAPSFAFNTSDRRVEVKATDRLNSSGSDSVSVMVDNDPPDIQLVNFNYSRPRKSVDGVLKYIVNGRVPITINVYDLSGVGNIRYWVLQSTTTPPTVTAPEAPTWDFTTNTGTAFPTGAAGAGASLPPNATNTYQIMLNTGRIGANVLTNGQTYYLYVIAADIHGNKKTSVSLVDFIVDQDSDYPELDPNLLSPRSDELIDPGITPLKIEGSVSDDDGFNSLRFAAAAYVRIRFPSSVNGTVITWGTWITMPASALDLSAGGGGINFSYSPPTSGATYPGLYLSTDGIKYYQIQVTDEATAGPNNDPPGKNGDAAVSKVFPSENGTNVVAVGSDFTYSFGIKTEKPKVYFRFFDPDPSHNGTGEGYNIRPTGRNDYNNRPIYKEVANLATDLNSGWVTESYFKSVTINYTSSTTATPKDLTTTTVGNRHTWIIDGTPANNDILSYLTTHFNAGSDGIHTITIEALDTTVNGKTSVEWSFYKDTTAPEVTATYNNVIKIDSGTVAINGTINDEYSRLAASYDYRFYTDPLNKPAYTTVTITAANLSNGNRTAKWSQNIPDTLLDGVCYLEIRVSDAESNTGVRLTDTYSSAAGSITNDYANNTRYFESISNNNPAGTRGFGVGSIVNIQGADRIVLWVDSVGIGPATRYRIKVSTGTTGGAATTVYPANDVAAIGAQIVTVLDTRFSFTVDRAAPLVSPTDKMMVTGTGIPTANNGQLPETERVFSASGLTESSTGDTFVLKGLVYERNLTELTATINPGGGFAPILLQLSGTAFEDWVKAGASTTYSAGKITMNPVTLPNTTADTTQFRITKATGTERETHSSSDPASIYVKSITDMDHLYAWELHVTGANIFTLIQRNSASGAVRDIVISAKDVAERNSVRDTWRFYLDRDEPKVEFLNDDTAYFTTLNLQGTVSDDTYVKSLEFALSKYNYATGNFEYYSGSAWTSTATIEWKNLLDSGYSPRKSVGWTLNNTTLTRNGLYTNNLLDTEGRYKLELRFSDYSLSATPNAGNPGTKTTEFYVDKNDPVISWVTERKEFYKSDAGTITFTLSASDANSIKTTAPSLAAVVREYGTTNTAGTVSITGTTPAGTPPASTLTVTVSGLDEGKRYTLTLTVTDGAGRVAVINNTLDFRQDDTPPAITITPSATNAIAGRVDFKGNFTKETNYSPVIRVAFKAGGANPVPATVRTLVAGLTGSDLDDALKDDGWILSDIGDGFLPTGTNIDTSLMKIDPGLATANITLYDTRDFSSASPYLTAADATLPSGLSFDGLPIPSGAKGHTLPLHFFAIDEAGNVSVVSIPYYIYPEGDIPTVTINNPNPGSVEVERLMNGRFRIGGTAKDNLRVKYVWFRILDMEPGANFEKPLAPHVPNWNTDTWESATGNQSPRELDYYDSKTLSAGGGWYMANGGGRKEVSWWAIINSDGELDPGTAASRKIKIEVIAEDTSYERNGLDYKVGENTGWKTREDKAGKVTATVVQGAPRFEDELIRLGGSFTGSASNPTLVPFTDPTWGSLATTNVSRSAAYAITVKHETGVGAIRWTRPDGTVVNLLEPTDPYVASTYGTDLNNMHTGTGTGPGIAVKAVPKTQLIGATITIPAVDPNPNKRTFMIWKAGSTSAPEGATENVPYTIFTVGSAVNSFASNGATLLPMTAEGVFEWVVVVDLNTKIINYPAYSLTDANAAVKQNPADGKWGSVSDRFGINLSATDISKSQPLTSPYEAAIPVDNVAPEAKYTLTTNIVGSAVSFGGEAGDKGIIGGLSKVVLWFSRNDDGKGTTPILWDELKGTGSFDYITTNPPTADDIENLPTIAGFRFPRTDYTGGSGNRSSLVIDRNDPMGNEQHHGHQQEMGLAVSGIGLGSSWYVTLDSTLIRFGRIYAHFVVYDKAGNASYYMQKLMILNGKPSIARVTLATDIRGGDGLALANNFNNNGANTGNLVNGARTATSGTNSGIGVITNTGSLMTVDTGTRPSVLNRIRARFRERVDGIDVNSSDAFMGINDTVAINTDRLNDYNVVYDARTGTGDIFTVRNNLLAVRVETLIPQMSGGSRNFRLEYVKDAAEKDASAIVEGRVYIIKTPGTFTWGIIGVQGENPRQGVAFIALENGSSGSGSGTVWELNSSYYGTGTRVVPSPLALDDVTYPATTAAEDSDIGNYAEFAYQKNAFGNNGIRDFNPQTNANATLSDFEADGRPKPYPFPSVTRAASPQTPEQAHSLFILRVFDGAETELFGDFALLSIRVNNEDKTKPFAQLYDLNPKTEGVGIADQDLEQALAPGNMGDNRKKGGVYNNGTTALIDKLGHIEPRRQTSLTSLDMGGATSAASATMQNPFANAAAFFEYDTVSGNVMVRGYAEDNQKIGSITLQFWSTAATPVQLGSDVRILESNTDSEAWGGTKLPAVGFMQTVGLVKGTNIDWTETLDLNRHRVEWAYVWNTEAVAGTPVGNINIKVIAHNASEDAGDEITRAQAAAANYGRPYDYFNPDFPANGSANTTPTTPGTYLRYNRIQVNIRPYITGFLRDQNEEGGNTLNTRSRQGRYMLRRGETAVIKGFNLGGATAPTITLPSGAATVQGNAVASNNDINNFGLAGGNIARYRVFTVPDTAATTTGHGMVTYAIGGFYAVNTGDGRGITTITTPVAARRPNAIQPWNIEHSTGRAGSELWDDFTSLHIWRSDNANTGNDRGTFLSSNNWDILNPAMSIAPNSGVLYASHNEGGQPGSTGDTAANTGWLMESANNGSISSGGNAVRRMRFRDPIVQSDIYRTANDSWMVTSVIGYSSSTGDGEGWRAFGGIYIRGPGGNTETGGNIDLSSGRTEGFYDLAENRNAYYLAESTWYNASASSSKVTNPPFVNQFLNPHIIVSDDNYIHVSYYDSKDSSIKYRYNRRGQAGTIDQETINGSPISNAAITAIGNIPKMWTNLDGGFDDEDTVLTTYAGNVGNGNIAENARVVNYNTTGYNRSTMATKPNTGKHNAIALTSQGYPVIAYYDESGSGKLKLAVSRSTTPILANNWVIRDNVIPSGNLSWGGTGQYVSIAIDTRAGATQNTIHMAAMNTNGNLVYIKGQLNPGRGTAGTYGAVQTDTTAAVDNVLTDVTVQVVDSLGTVGRWCNISLDASGNPWIAYQDAGYIGAKDGVKLAYLDATRFNKGASNTTFEGEDMDIWGESMSGWETMHVPTRFRVENPVSGTGEQGRIGLENFPTLRTPGATKTGLTNFAAVSYLGTTADGQKYLIAYYLK